MDMDSGWLCVEFQVTFVLIKVSSWVDITTDILYFLLWFIFNSFRDACNLLEEWYETVTQHNFKVIRLDWTGNMPIILPLSVSVAVPPPSANVWTMWAILGKAVEGGRNSLCVFVCFCMRACVSVCLSVRPSVRLSVCLYVHTVSVCVQSPAMFHCVPSGVTSQTGFQPTGLWILTQATAGRSGCHGDWSCVKAVFARRGVELWATADGHPVIGRLREAQT